MTNDCIFCGVIEGRIPSHIVYQNDQVVAFDDVHPQAPTHVLVVPRQHVATVLEMDERSSPWLSAMFTAATRIVAERGLSDRGFRLVFNCKAEAGQTVFHVHMRVLGGRPMGWPPG